jgi:cell division transport system permease protein
MHALRYAIDEAVASIWRGRQSGLLSTITIALALFVLGGFLLVTSNLQRLSAAWTSAAELSVYLNDDATAEDRRAIEGVLAAAPVVISRDYVAKDEALKRFKQTFADLSAAIDGAGESPLPASYEVRVMTGPDSRSSLQALADNLRQMAGVSDVRYDWQWMERLQGVISVIRGVGLALGSILVIAAALTVANVVRLALYSRRDELDIMQLVGAPQVYIRGPFVMEGVLQGGAGAVLALVGLLAGYFAIRARYLVPLASTVDLASIRFLPPGLCLGVVLGGMLVGCVGGLVAAWKQ